MGVPQDAIEDYIQDAGSCCYAIGTPLKIKKTCLPKYLETGITSKGLLKDSGLSQMYDVCQRMWKDVLHKPSHMCIHIGNCDWSVWPAAIFSYAFLMAREIL